MLCNQSMEQRLRLQKIIQMAQVALSKQQKEWNKQLTQHLDKYLYLRDWSQLAAWLSKLKHHLSEVKTTVVDKTNLLKRLATSLNASLPVALLQSTLEIYEILFAHFIITGDELQTTCIGLFSFYLQANIKNKSKIIEIFIKYLPVFGRDLQILATGLVITILPSLNQMQESLIKDVNTFLDLLSKPELIGREMMAQALWVAVLRSPSCRVAGLKYLSNKLGRGAQEEEHDEEDNFWEDCTLKNEKRQYQKHMDEQGFGSSSKIKDNQQKQLLKEYCPHIQTLIMNSISICIEDSNILAIKAGLDFLYKYLPLRSQALSHKSKLRIAKSVVWLLGKRDTSVTRKINLWLFGKPDDQNRYAVNQKQLCYITEAMIDFLQSDASLQPLKIAFNLLSEHQQLPILILHQLTPYLLQFCQKQENNSEVIKIMYRLVERLRPHLTIFSQSLSQGLIKSIKQKRFDDSQKMLNLSIFFLNKILKPEEIKSQVKSFLKMLLESSVLTCWQNREFMKLCLRQTLQLLQKHKELLKSLQNEKEQLELLNQHNTLYQNLLQSIFEKENERGAEDQIFLINRVIVKIQQVFNVYNEKWMPNLVTNIGLNNPQHFIAPIQVIGEAFQKQGLLKEQISLRAKDTTKNNCIKICMAKMWGILSLGHLQAKVIPLLLKFIKIFPGFFQKLLETQFQSSGELAIIKFRLFWEVGPKYPQIMNGDQVEQISKFGLFKMLQFLDSSNPLVKYHSHLWISQTFPAYHRIMNPILQTLLKPKQFWYQTPQGQFIYAVPPQTKQILQTLRHLKSFIRLVPEKFNKFAFKPLTTKVLPYYQIFKGHDPSEEVVEISYIAVLLKLVVRFTETKFVRQQNEGIDLSSCELLEVIVRNVNSPQMSNFILKEHFKSLLRSLHFATVNEEHLLQIQLLNLLKLILIDSQIRKLCDPKIIREAIGQNILTSTILEGVACSFPYIKQRFVQFLNQCVPLMLEYHPNCGQVISRVINTYSTKIAYVNSKKVEASSLKDLQISQKNAQILILFEGITELLSHFMNLNLKPFQKQKTQHDTDSGLFSFYSWKSYIHLKIHKRPEISKGKKIMDQISKQLINQLPSLIAIMAACWTFSELKPYYELERQGLVIFNYQRFLIYNKALGIAQSRLETEQSVESFIINLLRVLLNTYPEETMRALVTCWSLAFKDLETKLKILELLNFSCLPIQHFYAIMTQSINPQKIGKKRKSLSLELERNVQQDILHMCQTFSYYNFQNPSLFQTHNLMSIWIAFCKFIKIFDSTKNVLTLFSLIELVDLFISKNNPKQIVRDEKLKKELIFLINIHNDIILLCSGKLKIEANVKPIKFNSMFPLPSSVYQVHHDIKTDPTQMSPSYLQWEQVPSTKGAEYCRLLGLIIAKRVCYNILSCLQNDTEIMLLKRIREIAVAILPLVQDKEGNGLLVQGASELILGILQKKHVFVKELKYEILQIFNKEDFFICSSRTLQSWAKIIQLLIDSNKDHDIFQQYLEKVSLASSLFSSYTFETKKKIKSFERICFILYSGKKDKYNQKAHQLIDKIIEVIKNAEAPQPVLILIFFCIRILILRLSPDKLTKLLSNLWQMIIFLLNSIFSQEAHKDRLHLHWAALKLIEMISLMQIAEFHPHQWIFFYDFVGVKLSHLFDAPNSNQIKLGINPKIHKFLPHDIHLLREQIGAVEEKRHLIIKEDKIDDIELLKTKALLLSSYLIASNGYRMKFDMREVEELIDNDFLNLDEFIFKVK